MSDQLEIFPASTSYRQVSPVKTSRTLAERLEYIVARIPRWRTKRSGSSWKWSLGELSSRTPTTDGVPGCPNCGAPCGAEGMPVCRFECPPRKLERPICAIELSSLGGELLPTPTAQAYGSGQNGNPGDSRKKYRGAGKPSLNTLARTGHLPFHPPGRLRPRWLLWSMSLPLSWLDPLNDSSATPSSRELPKS